MKKHNIKFEDVQRHFDRTGKICPSPWVLRPEQYANYRQMQAAFVWPPADNIPLPETPVEPMPSVEEYFRVFVKQTAQKQLGAFKEEKNANAVLGSLNSLGLEGFITYGK
jgi:hypothetical protein